MSLKTSQAKSFKNIVFKPFASGAKNRYCLLIPLHGVAVAAALVILKSIGERGGVTTEREVVARVGSEHHLTAHVEAVEVALQRRGGHGHLVELEVVAR